MVAIRDDGQVVGSVSGGCVEDDLIDKVRKINLAGRKPELHLRRHQRGSDALGTALRRHAAARHGAALEAERIAELSKNFSQQLVRRGSRWKAAKRRLSQAAGRTCSSSTAACSPPCTARAGGWCSSARASSRAISPRWRACSTTVVVVIDPREEYAAGWDLAAVPINRGMPDDVVRELQLDGHSAIVALTHDPKLDDLALMEALKSAAFYVGAIGSKKNNDARRERPARVRRLGRGDRAAARTGGALHRLEDPARDRGRDPCRDDGGAPRRGRAEWAAKPERRFDPASEVKEVKRLKIVGLLLAAGSATRFGSDKLRHTLPHGVSIAVQPRATSRRS